MSGPLAAAAAANASVGGSQPITFTGSDAGSGVHTATLTLSPLSGGASYVHTFDFSGECAYDSWNACPLTETVSGFTVNTDALADGAYAASLAITDAAGNVSNDALGSITVSNATAIVSSLGALPGPGTTSSATGPAGSPNGSGASEGAHLQLGVRSPISRTYAKRALRVTGRLLNAQGLPIGGASLDVLQQVDGATLELDRSRPNRQRWDVRSECAGRPYAVVEIAYRAFSTDTGYAATAKLAESVEAGIQFGVEPTDRLGRRDHAQRARRGPRTQTGCRRRAARPLPRRLGALSHPENRHARRLPRQLPVPGRGREVPVPGERPRRAGRVRLRRRKQSGGRGHDRLTWAALTSRPAHWRAPCSRRSRLRRPCLRCPRTAPATTHRSCARTLQTNKGSGSRACPKGSATRRASTPGSSRAPTRLRRRAPDPEPGGPHDRRQGQHVRAGHLVRAALPGPGGREHQRRQHLPGGEGRRPRQRVHGHRPAGRGILEPLLASTQRAGLRRLVRRQRQLTRHVLMGVLAREPRGTSRSHPTSSTGTSTRAATRTATTTTAARSQAASGNTGSSAGKSA